EGCEAERLSREEKWGALLLPLGLEPCLSRGEQVCDRRLPQVSIGQRGTVRHQLRQLLFAQGLGRFNGSQTSLAVGRASDNGKGLRPLLRAVELLETCDRHRGQERQGRLRKGPGNQGGARRQGHPRGPCEIKLISAEDRVLRLGRILSGLSTQHFQP